MSLGNSQICLNTNSKSEHFSVYCRFKPIDDLLASSEVFHSANQCNFYFINNETVVLNNE